MGQALALAALGEGTTRPNPMVGAVVVGDGILLGKGFHLRAGSAHAEVTAIREAGDAARGSVLYVNLEPCSHHGRTPPCTDAILRAGISRVVLATLDPNPLVAGSGVQVLADSGVEVESGVRAPEAERLNQPYLTLRRTGRPIVTLKAAVSADGMIAARDGCSRWLTGETARRFAHRLRYTHDAVLVGAGTVRTDDPRLDVRLPIRAEEGPLQPKTVVLSGEVPVDRAARLFRRKRSGEVLVLSGREDGQDRLEQVLDELGREGIRSVLVEGGAQIFAAFLRAGLADRYAFFHAPVLLGAERGTPMVQAVSALSPDEGWKLIPEKVLPLGEDLVTLGRIQKG